MTRVEEAGDFVEAIGKRDTVLDVDEGHLTAVLP